VLDHHANDVDGDGQHHDHHADYDVTTIITPFNATIMMMTPTIIPIRTAMGAVAHAVVTVDDQVISLRLGWAA